MLVDASLFMKWKRISYFLCASLRLNRECSAVSRFPCFHLKKNGYHDKHANRSVKSKERKPKETLMLRSSVFVFFFLFYTYLGGNAGSWSAGGGQTAFGFQRKISTVFMLEHWQGNCQGLVVVFYCYNLQHILLRPVYVLVFPLYFTYKRAHVHICLRKKKPLRFNMISRSFNHSVILL